MRLVGTYSIQEISPLYNKKGGNEMAVYTGVYSRIKSMCKEQKLTIKELCFRSDVKQTAMQEWDESMPAADKLAAVADVLGTTVEELLRAV